MGRKRSQKDAISMNFKKTPFKCLVLLNFLELRSIEYSLGGRDRFFRFLLVALKKNSCLTYARLFTYFGATDGACMLLFSILRGEAIKLSGGFQAG